MLPSSCCSRFGADGCNLSAESLTARLEGLMKDLRQEKPSTLDDQSLGLYHCFYDFSDGIYNFLICLGEVHHNTFLSGDECRNTGYETAFQAFAKDKVFAAESKLPDPCPHTDPGMLCAGTTGHWSCCFCRLAGCKEHKTPKYPTQCSSSYISCLYSSVTWAFLGSLISCNY